MNKSQAAGKVLLVDDDDTFRRVLSAELERRGYEVVTAASGDEALRLVENTGADVVLLDLQMPGLDGIEALKRLRARDAPAGVVVLTGHGTIDTAIQAIRLGAYDYLEKPCPIDKVEMAIRKTREHLRLVARQRVLQDGYSPPDFGAQMVGAGPEFQKLRLDIKRIAATDSAVLVRGETGVGKEMVASLLHTEGPRRDAPYVVVDCAGLHEELLQSELFGHEKGAFTGAMRQKHGLFEVANGGTLFLDEVGDTNPDIQARLLRVLETGRFRRLGGTREIAVDVRVLSATNRVLRQDIERGHFREDLFFRLSTFTIEVPPLRNRQEDIRLLIDHFTDRFNSRFSFTRRFGSDAVDVLMRHPWPGNVRELMHVMEQAMVLANGDVIEPEDLPVPVRSRALAAAVDRPGGDTLSLQELQRKHVLAVLEREGGNRARTARVLGISERNLYRLLKRHGWSSEVSDARGDDRATP